MSTQANATPGATGAESANTPVNATELAAARKSERERMSAITTCEEAKGKSTLANHLAMNTEMSVDDAKGILKASAPEKSEQAAANVVVEPKKDNAFANAMASTDNPNVGADAQDETGKDKADGANPLLADWNKFNGIK